MTGQMTKRSPLILNDFQKAVLQDYSNGEYAYLIEGGVIENPFDLGDTLLTFLLIELSTPEGCESIDTAEARLNGARDEIDVALEAIDKLSEAIAEKLSNRSQPDAAVRSGCPG